MTPETTAYSDKFEMTECKTTTFQFLMRERE
jgi:hypothetical protein